MASVAERKFMEELAFLLQKTVIVQTASGKSYTGVLSGVDANTRNI
jgi:small nuclear ribonucleoprotein (snRNP)-like protein